MHTSQNPALQSRNFENGTEETISELAHRHLTDEHHTTTDEELMNAKLEFSGTGTGDVEVTENGEELPDITAAEKSEDTGNTPLPTSPLPNPYDVLGA